MDNGWITLHRKILDNPIFTNSNMLALWVTLLLLANHEEKKLLFNGKVETIGRGQLITGRNALARQTGIAAGSIPRYLACFVSLKMLNIKPNNKCSLITIVKYNDYQDRRQTVDRRTNTQRTSSEHLVNTNNNVNNDNNVTTTVGTAKLSDPVNEIFKLFYNTINPNLNFAHKAERSATEWLINRYGSDKVLSAAQFAISIQGDRYAPTITTPYQLKEKMAALIKYKSSHKEPESKTLIL